MKKKRIYRDYLVAQGSTIGALEDCVGIFARTGYFPTGGMTTGVSDSGLVYCQSMVRLAALKRQLKKI